MGDSEPIYFDSPGAFRDWLEEHHDREDVLGVGYWKRGTGRGGLTWTDSVREALCFGWIDGLRKSVDHERYRIRFTPRRPESHWSARNLAMVEELRKDGRMRPAGLAAWRFFQELAPGYTRTSIHWVMSAKREETRLRRLEILVHSCAEGRKIPLLRR